MPAGTRRPRGRRARRRPGGRPRSGARGPTWAPGRRGHGPRREPGTVSLDILRLGSRQRSSRPRDGWCGDVAGTHSAAPRRCAAARSWVSKRARSKCQPAPSGPERFDFHGRGGAQTLRRAKQGRCPSATKPFHSPISASRRPATAGRLSPMRAGGLTARSRTSTLRNGARLRATVAPPVPPPARLRRLVPAHDQWRVHRGNDEPLRSQ